MFIIGIDASINGSGIVKFEVDNDGEIISRDYFSFTSVLKREAEKVKFWHPKKSFSSEYEKFRWMHSHILDFIPKGSIVGIEDYALGGKGKVFNIAEFTGILKHKLIYEHDCKLKPFPPSSIKHYFSGNGSADKVIMTDEYLKDDILNIGFMDKYRSPQNDLVDAYAIGTIIFDEVINPSKIKAYINDNKKLKGAKVFNAPYLTK